MENQMENQMTETSAVADAGTPADPPVAAHDPSHAWLTAPGAPEMWTAAEVASHLGVTATSVWRWCVSGAIPGATLSSRRAGWRLPRAGLLAFLARATPVEPTDWRSLAQHTGWSFPMSIRRGATSYSARITYRPQPADSARGALRRARIAAGQSITALARQLGRSRNALIAIETGRAPVGVAIARAYEEALALQPQTLTRLAQAEQRARRAQRVTQRVSRATRDGDTGATLRAARLRADLTQEELAARAGVSVGSISAIEREHRRVSARIARACERALGLAPQTLPCAPPPSAPRRPIVDAGTGAALRAAREAAKLSLSQLATRLGCTRQLLSLAEVGRVRTHTLPARYEAALGLEVGSLPRPPQLPRRQRGAVNRSCRSRRSCPPGDAASAPE
jgi:transcriptional regulator with XRE-family HTH domain